MPWRDSPQWIDGQVEHYRRGRKVWLWGIGLLLVACTAGLFYLARHRWAQPGVYLATGYSMAFLLNPQRNRRARRYQAAIETVKTAILEYQKRPELSDSVLTEAAERARHLASGARSQIAPTWIRNRMRLLRLTEGVGQTAIFLAFSNYSKVKTPVGFVLVLVLTCILQIPLDFVRRAANIVFDAIEEYENGTSSGEDALLNAGSRASSMLNLRNMWKTIIDEAHSTDSTPNS